MPLEREDRQKFTVSEWLLAKHLRFSRSENARLEAERLLAESSRLREETSKNVVESMEDSNKRLEQRIEDVDYWRSEINMRQANITHEIDTISMYVKRFENALDGCVRPLDVTKQCLTLREQRQGIDLVHDSVQENLFKEIEVINGVKDLVFRSLEEIKEQLRLNRKIRYQLEHDLINKTKALKLDNFAVNLRPYSAELLADSKTCLEPYQSPPKDLNGGNKLSPCPADEFQKKLTVQEWRRLANILIGNAETEINHSIQFRGIMDGILSQVVSDLRYQWNLTDEALEKRIQETHATKKKLEDEHSHLEHEITSVEGNIEELQKSVASLEVPMTLAQTRLNVRDNRPNAEYCQDPATEKMMTELAKMQFSRESLREKIRESEKCLHELIRNKLEIEEDIKVKSQTVYIDEVQLATLRKSVVFQSY